MGSKQALGEARAMAHILLFFRQQMEPHAASRTSSPTLPRSRVWRDTVAEILLCAAVAVIALTGIEPFVLLLNRWLASVIPAYDPVVTMLALVIVVIGALTVGGIGLKVSVRRASEGTGAAACGAVPRAPVEQFPYGDTESPAPGAQRAVLAASGDSRSDKSLTATPSNRVSEESPTAAGLARFEELTASRLNP